MSDDILDQLAAYGRFHRLHQTSVTIADVAEHSTGRPPVAEPQLPRRPRPWLIAATAVLAAALLIAGIVLLQGTGDDHIRNKPANPGPAPTTPPVVVDTATEATPLGELTHVPATFLSPRTDAAAVWTGGELFVWGGRRAVVVARSEVGYVDGATFDPTTRSWRAVPPAPVAPSAKPSAPVAVALDDRRVAVFWGRAAALWDPTRQSWAQLPDAPTAVSSAVWTGDQVVAVGHQGTVGLLDLLENRWAETQPPRTIYKPIAIWTGRHAIVLGSPAPAGSLQGPVQALALDPRARTWRDLPAAPDVTAQAFDAAWTGTAVVVLDYNNQAAQLEPETGEWTSMPRIDREDSEWGPLATSVGGQFIVIISLDIAKWTGVGWQTMPVWQPRQCCAVAANTHRLFVFGYASDPYTSEVGEMRLDILDLA